MGSGSSDETIVRKSGNALEQPKDFLVVRAGGGAGVCTSTTTTTTTGHRPPLARGDVGTEPPSPEEIERVIRFLVAAAGPSLGF